MSQSSSMWHSSSHGPSRKACSSRREARRLGREQLAPLGRAGEQLAVPPHRAGFERFALGLRHRRQQLDVRLEEAAADDRLAQRADVQQPERREHQPQEAAPHRPGALDSPRIVYAASRMVNVSREGQEREPLVSEEQNRGDEQQRDGAACRGGGIARSGEQKEDDDRAEHGRSSDNQALGLTITRQRRAAHRPEGSHNEEALNRRAAGEGSPALLAARRRGLPTS